MPRTGRTNRPFGTAEGISLEFKRATNKLPSKLFETVCAFLNMDGGLVVLGVEDDGEVSGVDPTALERLKADITNLSNNPQKLDPPYLLFPQGEQVDNKWVIKVQVPASSQVHETAGVVFLRSEDGDYRVKGVNRLAGLLNRKLGIFTEQRVFPHLGMADFDPTLFERARRLMLTRQPKHPWAGLPSEDLLRVAGFVRTDPDTGKPSYNLAAGLMFGFDTTIQELVPGYKFDALLRRKDTERYDDRLIVRTNLIDAFDQLMGFVEKHLNDPFYQEGVTSISLRTVIFRGWPTSSPTANTRAPPRLQWLSTPTAWSSRTPTCHTTLAASTRTALRPIPRTRPSASSCSSWDGTTNSAPVSGE